MARGIIILLLIILAMFFIFEISDKTVSAQTKGKVSELKEVMQNQKLILEKLNTIDKKLDVIKMRIRL
jgi:peptidoglycan hydrolase CwlO-like protein